ncbi:MAG: O-antigen ligase domain-containing protein [Phormidesmis sp.]
MTMKKEKIFPLRPATGWTAIALFIIATLLTLAGAPSLLNLSFTATAVIVGAFLYFKHPLLYIGFSWWLWFLSPLVRRLADYYASYTDPSPIILAPYVVSLISGLKMLTKLRSSKTNVSVCFIISATGTVYALLVGLIKASYVSAMTNSLEWICPVLFGFYMYSQWPNYPRLEKTVKQIFLWCVLITGAYGLIQYLVLPEWDQVWLQKTIEISENARAFGSPEPLKVRVWSTMNSSGVFAQVMMAGLLLLLSEGSFLSSLAAPFGYLTFLLSLVRSAWIGWIVGIATLFTSLKSNLQIKLILTIVVAAVFALPLVFLDPFSGFITERVQSLTSPGEDGSAGARLDTYSRLLGAGLTNFVGNGFGFDNGLLDSAILDILLTLGWIGTIFYIGGALPLLRNLFSDHAVKQNTFSSAVRAVCLGTIAQMPFGSVMLGLPGMVLWSFLGLGLAGQQYRKNRELLGKLSINSS